MGIYYRGVTNKFLFKKTILRFNEPTSTTVSPQKAENFANGSAASSNTSNNGLILTLKPHWGDCRGDIRAFSCRNYSEFSWEEEYLFIGGLEPLVIHDIKEVRAGGERYFYKVQA